MKNILYCLVVGMFATTCSKTDLNNDNEHNLPSYRFESIEYSFDEGDTARWVTIYFKDTTFVNNTSKEVLSQGLTVNYTLGNTSIFGEPQEGRLSLFEEVKVKLPDFSEQVAIDLNRHGPWFYGQSETKNSSTVTDSIPIVIPPFNEITVTYRMKVCKISANYKAVFRNQSDESLAIQSGKWEGFLNMTHTLINIQEKKDGKVVRSFTYIPTKGKAIDLNSTLE